MKAQIGFKTNKALLKFISKCLYVNPKTDDLIPVFYDIEIWFPSRSVFVTFFMEEKQLIEILDVNKITYSGMSVFNENIENHDELRKMCD